ncbi:unnamed protein product [Onchocerca ochengi]|uniref:THO complex subunit 7 homolog n=1 Tax=Onchocerca ochengi TaxID=42157 RepID=A0A182EAQ7_ONCOC|nr:unnamed protein product [Onchocerca ochengi]
MYSVNIAKQPTIAEINDDVQTCVTAKRLAGMIRTLKEQIIDEMNIEQETNTENCQLEINIHRFQERLKELDILYLNCETSNAEIQRRKKRYSEQLAKISKLVSEQNFDAANWAIILDEMVFVNRELFEILMSTAIAERRALQMEIIEEEKYRFIAEKLVLKRTELRQELHSQMNSYELLRAQINQIENNLMNLQKTIDVYDAEYWQLNDARDDLKLQIFQLQQLLRQRRRCCLNSSNKSSSSHNDNDDNDHSMNDKCLTVQRKKSNSTIPSLKILKKENNSIVNTKYKDQIISKTMPEMKHNASDKNATEERMESRKNAIKKKEMAMINQASSSSLDIRSNFIWIKETRKKNQSLSPDSSISSSTSYFFVEHHKTDFKLMEIKKQIKYSQPVKSTKPIVLSPNSAGHSEFQKSSLMNRKQKEKNSEEMKKITVDRVDIDRETTIDLQNSNKENTIDSSKSSKGTISDDETTDLTSESISISDKLPNTINELSSIRSDIKEQEKEPSHSYEIRKVVDNTDCELNQSHPIKKLSPTRAIKSSLTYQSSSPFDSSSKQQTEIRQPFCSSRSESISEISIDNKKHSKVRNGSDSKVKFPGIRLLQKQQQPMYQPCYNRFHYQAESDEQRSGSLSLQYQSVELWQEISEKTFLHDIAS